MIKNYNINLKIWLEDIRYQSSPWRSINQDDQKTSTQNKIYLTFKQGARSDLDLEGHYNPLIPNIKSNQQLRVTIYNDLNQLNEITILKKYIKKPEQNNEKAEPLNILIWNAKSIGNFTKKKYLTQTLYTKNIQIALIQETRSKMRINGTLKNTKSIDQTPLKIEKESLFYAVKN